MAFLVTEVFLQDEMVSDVYLRGSESESESELSSTTTTPKPRQWFGVVIGVGVARRGVVIGVGQEPGVRVGVRVRTALSRLPKLSKYLLNITGATISFCYMTDQSYSQ